MLISGISFYKLLSGWFSKESFYNGKQIQIDCPSNTLDKEYVLRADNLKLKRYCKSH